MTLRQLELFIAVAETGSFSRGAEKIHLTQSTVSQHISTLEDQAGTRLLDRDRNGAFLTAAGEMFLQHARRILAERDLLQQSLAAFNGLENVSLRIGASNIPANHLIPTVLPDLAARYPGITLTVETGDSRGMLEKLAAAEIELAVVGGGQEDPRFAVTALETDLLVLVVGRDHPWRRQRQISLEDLATGRFVMREAGSGSGLALQRALQRVGSDVDRLPVAARLGSNEAVCRTVVAGFGCAFVSERSVRRELETGELFPVTVAGLRVEREFWLASLRGRSLSPAGEVFRDLLCARCREEGR